MREYLAGYRDAIEKVFEIQKDKPGFPTLKQILLEDYFEKSAFTGPFQRYVIPDKAYPALGHPKGMFNLTGNDDAIGDHMQEYLAGYRDAIEKVFEIQKDKQGFPSLKQALLEDYFEKTAYAHLSYENSFDAVKRNGDGLNKKIFSHVEKAGSSISSTEVAKKFSLIGNDDAAFLESKEL